MIKKWLLLSLPLDWILTPILRLRNMQIDALGIFEYRPDIATPAMKTVSECGGGCQEITATETTAV